MDMKRISKRLVSLRKSKELTQAQLAEVIHYSDKVISKWERGESLPSIEAVKVLADFYQLSLDDLLDDTHEFNHHQRMTLLNIKQSKGPSH